MAVQCGSNLEEVCGFIKEQISFIKLDSFLLEIF